MKILKNGDYLTVEIKRHRVFGWSAEVQNSEGCVVFDTCTRTKKESLDSLFFYFAQITGHVKKLEDGRYELLK